jgi:hypothetical protein
LIGHVELAGVVADGVENVFRHAQGDRLGRGAQPGEAYELRLGPIDVIGTVIFG